MSQKQLCAWKTKVLPLQKSLSRRAILNGKMSSLKKALENNSEYNGH